MILAGRSGLKREREMPFDKSKLKTASEDGLNVVLAEPLTYTALNGERITVPAGADSDGASTPRFLWRVFPPFGNYWRAALLHDYLYRHTDRPKAECDRLFLEAMRACSVPRMKAETIYLGVKWFGGPAFRNCRSKGGNKR